MHFEASECQLWTWEKWIKEQINCQVCASEIKFPWGWIKPCGDLWSYTKSFQGQMLWLNMFMVVNLASKKKPNYWPFLASIGYEIILFEQELASSKEILANNEIVDSMFRNKVWFSMNKAVCKSGVKHEDLPLMEFLPKLVFPQWQMIACYAKVFITYFSAVSISTFYSLFLDINTKRCGRGAQSKDMTILKHLSFTQLS